ncbi:aspartate racemase, partial [Klebsiella pneumoniae]|nr:aspartate racemase [Klebsiella pneumoniae]
MKRLGLLGGMSWESSIQYERWINEAVRDRLGGTASADLVIRSFNFADIEALQEADDWAGAADVL